MRLERHGDHRRWIGGPVPPGADAITLGSLIVLRAGVQPSPYLIRHELVHVRQWRRHGVMGFAVRYLGAYLRSRARGDSHRIAYLRIPLEVEADWVARRSLLAGAPADAAR